MKINIIQKIFFGLLLGVILVLFHSAAKADEGDQPDTAAAPREDALSAPDGLRAMPEGERDILLVWQPVSGSVGYRIYCGKDTAVDQYSTLIAVTDAGSLQYRMSGVKAGILYNFRVSAVSGAEEGPLSQQVGVSLRAKNTTHAVSSDVAP